MKLLDGQRTMSRPCKIQRPPIRIAATPTIAAIALIEPISSSRNICRRLSQSRRPVTRLALQPDQGAQPADAPAAEIEGDRKSTSRNSSHYYASRLPSPYSQ